MAYLLTNRQMREADEYTMKTLGVDGFSLMERAGNALARLACKLAPQGKIAIVCGGGNNGGDGLVCARFLLEERREIDVVLLSETLSSECQKAKNLFLDKGGVIQNHCNENQTYTLVVDCMLGTGFHGEFSPAFSAAAKAIRLWKEKGTKVLSADIPSGVNGDNGFALKDAVQADYTLCIGERKAGVYLHDGIDYAGKIFSEDIGISLPKSQYAQRIDEKQIKGLFPKRKRNVHKGTFGRAAIVAGSERYTGAAALALSACLRSGAGYVTLFAPKNVLQHFVLKYPEALLESINDGGKVAFTEENFKKLLSYDAIAYGMGMGNSEDTALGAKWLLSHYQGKLLIDADGLNALAQFFNGQLKDLLQNATCEVLLSPHVKEFSRLTKLSVEEILQGGFSAPVAFAQTHKVCVLLKNAVSILTDGTEIFVNTKGTSGQAKGGSGDVLSGVIVGLCASGLSVMESAAAASYLTGLAAEIATREMGVYSLLPTDVISTLGRAFLTVTENTHDKGDGE